MSNALSFVLERLPAAQVKDALGRSKIRSKEMKRVASDKNFNQGRNNKNRKEENTRYSEGRKYRIWSMIGYELEGASDRKKIWKGHLNSQ